MVSKRILAGNESAHWLATIPFNNSTLMIVKGLRFVKPCWWLVSTYLQMFTWRLIWGLYLIGGRELWEPKLTINHWWPTVAPWSRKYSLGDRKEFNNNGVYQISSNTSSSITDGPVRKLLLMCNCLNSDSFMMPYLPLILSNWFERVRRDLKKGFGMVCNSE